MLFSHQDMLLNLIAEKAMIVNQISMNRLIGLWFMMKVLIGRLKEIVILRISNTSLLHQNTQLQQVKEYAVIVVQR